MPQPLTTHGELVGLVPVLLGRHCRHCVVVITTVARRISRFVGVELPAPNRYTAFAADLVITTLAYWEFERAVLIVVDDVADTAASAPPHDELIRDVCAEAAREDVTISHALWATATHHGATWRCYGQSLCRGTVTELSDRHVLPAVALDPAAIAEHVCSV